MDDHYSFSIEVMGCASSKEVDLIVSCSFQLPVVPGGEDQVAQDM